MISPTSRRHPLRDRRGIASAEYAVMGGGLVLLVAIAGINLGTALDGGMSRITCTIAGACATAPAPEASAAPETPSPPPDHHHHHDD